MSEMTSSNKTFSARHGFQQPPAEISVREDAPHGLRAAIIMLAYKAGMQPSQVRDRICEVLLKRPDAGNWSEYPNIAGEVDNLIDEAPWHKVYDIAENIHEQMAYWYDRLGEAEKFESALNGYMQDSGIGWQMEDGKIVSRGSEAFGLTLHDAVAVMKDAGSETAAQEIHEALADISRRPHADITGAIQHAMAALECVAREFAGSTETLGKIIPNLGLPKPMDEALVKLWGFTSEQGRHIREGRNPRYEEAELVVTIAAAMSTYLIRAKALLGGNAKD